MSSTEETTNAVVDLFYRLIAINHAMTINDCPEEWHDIKVRDLVKAKIENSGVNISEA